ncbi:helix-turn-helix domain-containing protein [Candidatus Gracilibacteria bacterium]|nr:helix-turn-helix domain-containing protein [Candidatus Gracilibacteria bacterium]
MTQVDSEIFRSNLMGKTFKQIIKSKGLTMVAVAEKMGVSHPSVINVLNGKKQASDTFFTRVANAIELSVEERKDIFKQIDRKEYEHRYGEKINEYSDSEIAMLNTIPEEVKIAFMNGDKLDSHDISLIVDFIQYRKKKDKE